MLIDVTSLLRFCHYAITPFAAFFAADITALRQLLAMKRCAAALPLILLLLRRHYFHAIFDYTLLSHAYAMLLVIA